MNHSEYMAICGRKLDEGQARLSAMMRLLVERADPELYEHLAQSPDALFLEPLLFAHFANQSQSVPLSQIVVGGLDPEARPDVLTVRTDQLGRLYIPGLGYWSTSLPDRELALNLESDRVEFELHAEDGQKIEQRFEPALRIDQASVEIARYQHALLAPLFFDAEGQVAQGTSLEDAPTHHAGHMSRAFQLVEKTDPLLGAQMRSCVRLLVPFRNRALNSFAAIAAHGAVFFSTRARDSEPFFVDDLLHQCSHVIFNAMSVRRSDYLEVDPQLRVDSLTRGKPDGRSIYGALHGLFGEYHMCRVMQRLNECAVFEGRAATELLGRFAFIARKFLLDASVLALDVYTSEGRALFEFLAGAARQLRAERADLWAVDMSGQGYVFDFELFARTNA